MYNDIKNHNYQLNMIQQLLLNRLKVLFPRIADLIGGQVLIFTRNENGFNIVNGYEPHTTFNPIEFDMQNLNECKGLVKILKKVFYDKGKGAFGLQNFLGRDMEIYAYPILSDDDIIAVAILGVNIEDSKNYGFHRLINLAELIIKNGERSIISCINTPITHNSGILVTDRFSRIIYANKVIQRIYYKFGVVNLLGLPSDSEILKKGLKKEIVNHNSPNTKELVMDNSYLIQKEWPIFEAGNLVLKIIIVEDITEVRKKDREIKIKGTVIREIHHRMKNNLQTVASLLRMQGRRSKNDEVKRALLVAENRIMSIGIVHSILAQESANDMEVGPILDLIAKHIDSGVRPGDYKIEYLFNWEKIMLKADIINNIAMIFNELILNALEHGLVDKKEGVIQANLKLKDYKYIFSFKDNGKGFDNDVIEGKNRSLGLNIVYTLIEEQLGGKINLKNENGAKIIMEIPV